MPVGGRKNRGGGAPSWRREEQGRWHVHREEAGRAWAAGSEGGGGGGAAPDCPSSEGSEDVSVTNSEVESTMNHRRCRAVLRDPEFLEEAFSAFSSADAYIQTARNGLSRATKQYLTDVRVSFFCPNKITICQ